jgi:hypothetical protein
VGGVPRVRTPKLVKVEEAFTFTRGCPGIQAWSVNVPVPERAAPELLWFSIVDDSCEGLSRYASTRCRIFSGTGTGNQGHT